MPKKNELDLESAVKNLGGSKQVGQTETRVWVMAGTAERGQDDLEFQGWFEGFEPTMQGFEAWVKKNARQFGGAFRDFTPYEEFQAWAEQQGSLFIYSDDMGYYVYAGPVKGDVYTYYSGFLE